MVQWLGLGAFTAKGEGWSLVGQLRSCKPRGAVKKKETHTQKGGRERETKEGKKKEKWKKKI